MADFLKCANRSLEWEEISYDTNKDDVGNWSGKKAGEGTFIGSKGGITWNSYKAVTGKMPTAQDIKNLTKNDIFTKFFKAMYWREMQGDRINDQKVAELIFDWMVQRHGTCILLIAQDVLKYGKEKAVSIQDRLKFTDEMIDDINGSNPESIHTSIWLARWHHVKFSKVYVSTKDTVLTRVESFKDFPQTCTVRGIVTDTPCELVNQYALKAEGDDSSVGYSGLLLMGVLGLGLALASTRKKRKRK
jgi:lysozyme family protein